MAIKMTNIGNSTSLVVFSGDASNLNFDIKCNLSSF